MRGAASPTSRSSIRGRSRRNSARRSATASMAATIASRSARGTASPTPPRANRAFLPRAELAAPALADLLALDDAGFRAVFAGSPIKRIGRDRMVRNAAIAAGNSGAAGAGAGAAGADGRRGCGGGGGGALGARAAQRACSPPAERGDAGGAIDVAAVGQAGVDMGDDRLARPRAADRDRRRARRPGRGTGACAPALRGRRDRDCRTGR